MLSSFKTVETVYYSINCFVQNTLINQGVIPYSSLLNKRYRLTPGFIRVKVNKIKLNLKPFQRFLFKTVPLIANAISINNFSNYICFQSKENILKIFMLQTQQIAERIKAPSDRYYEAAIDVW